MRKVEYREGPKATEKFEKAMKALFQVPKDAVLLKATRVLAAIYVLRSVVNDFVCVISQQSFIRE
jgi:hypothetical protein